MSWLGGLPVELLRCPVACNVTDMRSRLSRIDHVLLRTAMFVLSRTRSVVNIKQAKRLRTDES